MARRWPRFGIARGFVDDRNMLKEQDVELVTITSPNHLHAEMTCRCVEAGKNVVCEKPLCLNLEVPKK